MAVNKPITGLAIAAAFAALSPGSAAAGPKARPGAVTAFSDYGNGKLTAPVRKAQYGYQVRLPGGLWYYCEVSCQDTLRREALDFWETRSAESGGSDFD